MAADPIPPGVFEKLDALTDRSAGPNACHPMTPVPASSGYVHFNFGGVLYYGHVLACWREHGPRPEGRYALHTCDVKRCANGAHLYWGTPADNMRDKVERGRQTKGADHPGAKLDPEKVRDIRHRYAAGGVRQADLADEYGVSPTLIVAIINRRAWKHID